VHMPHCAPGTINCLLWWKQCHSMFIPSFNVSALGKGNVLTKNMRDNSIDENEKLASHKQNA
jgi:hypothetical protein